MKLSISVAGPPCRDGTTTTCAAEFQLDQFDADAESRLHRVTRHCVDAVSGRVISPSETAAHSSGRPDRHERSNSRDGSPRLATAKQVAAIRAIARRKGVDLDHLLQDRFGVADVSALSIRQASSLIGELKESRDAA
ncbi:hypothetical protein Mal15_19170 [Stieleria maiorica]|uniref:Uncharacterized protein n=1 Tax=Stieleria maiorica TaxID=2795974 RepID=A0A5B9M9E7_9BACT|nr:hypothetical protein [Stieleria maiorica]QEF97871.1 hypothetical protein Mal15_19170 [Stieleria maiorica]